VVPATAAGAGGAEDQPTKVLCQLGNEQQADTKHGRLRLMQQTTLQRTISPPARAALRRLIDFQLRVQAGKSVSPQDARDSMLELYRVTDISSMVPLLPHLLTLEGKPYTIDRFFPMQPMFHRFNVPLYLTLKAGRQISKSRSLAAQSVLQAMTTPHFKLLYVNPLQAQALRFSTNYVQPFIDTSPIRRGIVMPGDPMNVTQRTLANGSILTFIYAFLNCDRARGIPADRIVFDEAQDMDPDHVPVIAESLSASDWKQLAFAGSSKTIDGLLETKFQESTMTEWVIKCDVCGKWNTCCVDQQLDDMIQEPGMCCAFCYRKGHTRLVNPAAGHWQHMRPDRRGEHLGLHLPQPIFPIHYANERAWNILYTKKLKLARKTYLNEVLGEAVDEGNRFVTRAEIMAASKLGWKNRLEEAAKVAKKYSSLWIGIDWGGGAGGIIRRRQGKIIVEGGTNSYTAVAVVGFNGGPKAHVLYGKRYPVGMKVYAEIKDILNIIQTLKVQRIAHDFNGNGSTNHAILTGSGISESRIIPIIYGGRSGGEIMRFSPPSDENDRQFWTLDKGRSMSLTVSALKALELMFPQWGEEFEPMEDFTSLIEEKYESSSGPDVYRITYNPKVPNDFCHAVNYACQAHWHEIGATPELAKRFGVQVSEDYIMSVISSTRGYMQDDDGFDFDQM
jgi:hypothetical protein